MSFEEDLKETQKPLKKYVSSVIFNQEDANDIVQNTNKILLNKESSYKEDGNFLSWAITIAKFQIKAYLTKRKRSWEVLSPCDEDFLLGSDFLSDAPLAHLIEDERLEIIKKINNILGVKEAIIFDLLTKDLTIPEMCDKTGLSYGAVSALKRRVITKIKKLIKNIQATSKFDFR